MTKDKVLSILKKSRKGPISGEKMALDLGVSRSAIWKAIKELRKEGHNILAKTNVGYMLEEDYLDEAKIKRALTKKVNIKVFDSLFSTNTEANRIAENSKHLTTIIANEQTQGKGRRGRSFSSPKGSSIYLSIILKPEDMKMPAEYITVLASLGVRNAINKVTGKEPMIKWVNDIYVDEKKVCGILTEAVTDFEIGEITHLILGIGVNCFNRGFPRELLDIIGFVGDEKKFTRNKLIGEIINSVTSLLEENPKKIIEEYKRYSLVIGKDIYIFKTSNLPKEMPQGLDDFQAKKIGDVKMAKAIDIDEQGGIVVQYRNGKKETLRSGEISIRVKG